MKTIQNLGDQMSKKVVKKKGLKSTVNKQNGLPH